MSLLNNEISLYKSIKCRGVRDLGISRLSLDNFFSCRNVYILAIIEIYVLSLRSISSSHSGFWERFQSIPSGHSGFLTRLRSDQ